IRERKKYDSSEVEENDFTYEEKGFENYDGLYDQINNLDEDIQTIIKLRFYEELSLKEIADIMKMNLNTTKSKLYRGLNILKISIKEEELWNA
ncbi:MAG: sigma factor-like helix-turn-helix DNA-binding protein, partial [Eubacteriales bacterium]|nr:sigma factor-like helix-turn-helix DNA-binding protein [Eubacteriales bacterium]